MSSIAEGRPKRATAGNRMAKLITGEEAEKDEFYETAYGGFKETEGDKEYEEEKDAVPEDDTVDSDFDKEEDEAAVPKTNGNGTPSAEKRPSETGTIDAAEEPAAKKIKEADVEKEEETPAVIEAVEKPAAPTLEEEPKPAAPNDPEVAADEAAKVAVTETTDAADGEKGGVEQPSEDAVAEAAPAE